MIRRTPAAAAAPSVIGGPGSDFIKRRGTPSSLGKAPQYTLGGVGVVAKVPQIQRQPVAIKLHAAGWLWGLARGKDVSFPAKIFVIGLACVVVSIEMAEVF
jgi:hypothetical protein